MSTDVANLPGSTTVSAEDIFAQKEASDLIINYLEQLSVDYIFGIPGGAIEPLYNALARSSRRGSVRPILARHESGAAFMADGYTRETGKLGVCCSTTGPGATNLITGVACAFENEIPMLVITAQSALPTFGKFAFQESSCTGVNTVGMFQHCTRYNTLVSHIDQLEHKLVSAILHAYLPIQGPVHLSIPVDVLRTPLLDYSLNYNLPTLLKRPAQLDLVALQKLYEEVMHAKKPVILIGDGCFDAVNLIIEFATILKIPFVTTPQAKGLVNANHPLNKGVFGFAGHMSAMSALQRDAADLIVAVGSTFGEWTSAAWSEVLLNDRLIHVDGVEKHLVNSLKARLHVRGTISIIFEHLIKMYREANPNSQHLDIADQEMHGVDNLDGISNVLAPMFAEFSYTLVDPEKCSSNAVPIAPQRLMSDLSTLFPPNVKFLADTGNSTAWAIHYLHPFDRRLLNRRPLTAEVERNIGRRVANNCRIQAIMEFGAMGWAIGAAIGTALGRNSAVVCITGDGSFLMNGQEISVAVAEKLPVVFVILNDGALGMVKHGQRLSGAEPIAYELPPVDFCAFAKAMHVEAYTIRTPADLLAVDFEAICQRNGPTLLDVYIDPEEIPPMSVRIKVLEGSIK